MSASGDSREHRSFEDMAVAHVLGGLQSTQARLFRSHLLDCADCRARVGELRAIAHDLASVERDERRERNSNAVETKPRKREQVDLDPDVGRRRSGAYRVLVFAVLGLFIALVAYTAMLRTSVTDMEQRLEVQQDAFFALEHGQALPVVYKAPGVVATAKRHEGNVVLLLEGLDERRPYGVFLIDDTGAADPEADDQTRVVYRSQELAADGRLRVLIPIHPDADRLIVTDPRTAFSTEPVGESVFEATLDPRPES